MKYKVFLLTGLVVIAGLIYFAAYGMGSLGDNADGHWISYNCSGNKVVFVSHNNQKTSVKLMLPGIRDELVLHKIQSSAGEQYATTNRKYRLLDNNTNISVFERNGATEKRIATCVR